jgi:isocitrate dehydrogenase kinase/phosphatase
LSDDQNISDTLAEQALEIIWTGFDGFAEAFAIITQRAGQRFERRDWQGMRRDTVERLDLYTKIVDETVNSLLRFLGPKARQPALWATIKTQFSIHCRGRCDFEIACTFYNSTHRKVFSATGIDHRLIFMAPSQEDLPKRPELFFEFTIENLSPETIRTVLSEYQLPTPFENLAEDARLCALRIGELIDRIDLRAGGLRIEMLNAPFFRGMSVYLVGRLCWSHQQCPLVFALDNGSRGLYVDALLSTPEQLRILFSFSRAYFHVRTQCPRAIVAFIKSLIPEKRIAELYIALGYHKHGKTELYRDLLQHQQVCSLDRFDFAPGKHGMVMIAFSMPNDDLIYKLIRDRFDTPKQTTAKLVMEKYDFVFKHDRAGRLLDVQTFENLELEQCCFTPELLSEIQTEATRAATVQAGRVILHHAYVERRVTPLDLFLQQADSDAAEAAIVEYGRAIKDLARINIFPGDMLIKNFGVTRLGRVVFYDYDELYPLLDCNFRKLPQARQYEDELSSEPWFMVAEHDVFPEEFAAFLGLSARLRQIFLKYHGDLLEPEFWQQAQAEIRSGTWSDVRPYGEAQRLKRKNHDEFKA